MLVSYENRVIFFHTPTTLTTHFISEIYSLMEWALDHHFGDSSVTHTWLRNCSQCVFCLQFVQYCSWRKSSIQQTCLRIALSKHVSGLKRKLKAYMYTHSASTNPIPSNVMRSSIPIPHSCSVMAMCEWLIIAHSADQQVAIHSSFYFYVYLLSVMTHDPWLKHVSTLEFLGNN